MLSFVSSFVLLSPLSPDLTFVDLNLSLNLALLRLLLTRLRLLFRLCQIHDGSGKIRATARKELKKEGRESK